MIFMTPTLFIVCSKKSRELSESYFWVAPRVIETLSKTSQGPDCSGPQDWGRCWAGEDIIGFYTIELPSQSGTRGAPAPYY